MNANRMQKPIAKAARARLRKCSAQAASGEPRRRRPRHRLRAAEVKKTEHGAGEVERGQDIEVRRQAEMVGERRRHQAAEQVARDVAGDVGREGAGRVRSAALFGEVRERQREGRRHEKALGDAQRREGGEVGRHREQGGRDREQRQADQDAAPAVDLPAEKGDGARRPPCRSCWR